MTASLQLVPAIARSIWLTLLVVVLLGIAAIAVGVALGLSLTGAIGLYFVVWWTVLFIILPVRIRSQAELGTITQGTDPGAPASPALYERALWTSIASGILFALVAFFFPLAGL
jgi:predicted secreted protein